MVLLSVVLLMTLYGCGKPPVTEMNAANNAIIAADSAGAATYAPEQFSMATDTLEAANTEKLKQDQKSALVRDYKGSQALFIKAEALAKDAEIKAIEGLNLFKQQVQNLIGEASMQLDQADSALVKAIANKNAKVNADYFKQKLTSLRSEFGGLKNQYEIGDIGSVKSGLQVVIMNTQMVQEEIGLSMTKQPDKKKAEVKQDPKKAKPAVKISPKKK